MRRVSGTGTITHRQRQDPNSPTPELPPGGLRTVHLFVTELLLHKGDEVIAIIFAIEPWVLRRRSPPWVCNELPMFVHDFCRCLFPTRVFLTFLEVDVF